jgi:hypothetical protein
VRVVGVRGIHSPLGAKLAQPIEQYIDAPLRGGRLRLQDPEVVMIYAFSLSVSFSY